MPSNFTQVKQEASELLNKKKRFLVLGFVLFGGFLILLLFGLVTLFGAIEGKLHYQAAAILLILAFNCLVGAIVMWILSKTIYERRLRERQYHINNHIETLKTRKVHHSSDNE